MNRLTSPLSSRFVLQVSSFCALCFALLTLSAFAHGAFIAGVASHYGHSATTISLVATEAQGGKGSVITKEWRDSPVYPSNLFTSGLGTKQRGLQATITGLAPYSDHYLWCVFRDSAQAKVASNVIYVKTAAAFTDLPSRLYNSNAIIDRPMVAGYTTVGRMEGDSQPLNGGNTHIIGRQRHPICYDNVTNVALVYVNTGSATDLQIRAWVTVDAGTPVPVPFDDGSGGTTYVGSLGATSAIRSKDIPGIKLSRSNIFRTYSEWYSPSGGNIVAGASTRFWGWGTSSLSPANADALQNSVKYAPGPAAVLGLTPTLTEPNIAYLGSSSGYGNTDNTYRDPEGYTTNGGSPGGFSFRSFGAENMPFLHISPPGSNMAWHQTRVALETSLLAGCHIVYGQLGQNDIPTSMANWTSRLKAIEGAARSAMLPGGRFYCQTLLPRNSDRTYVWPANKTDAYGVSRAAFNPWMRATYADMTADFPVDLTYSVVDAVWNDPNSTNTYEVDFNRYPYAYGFVLSNDQPGQVHGSEYAHIREADYLRSNLFAAGYFDIFAPVPAISVSNGMVTLSEGTRTYATLHYTTDGSDPTSKSPAYSVPFAASPKTLVKAAAFPNPVTDWVRPSAIASIVTP